MINADRNRFIKQHVELYGEELFLDSITKKSKKSSFKLSKVDLLKNLSSKVDIDLSFDKKILTVRSFLEAVILMPIY